MENKSLYRIRERLMDELDKIGKKDGDIATAEMESIYKLTASIKAIDKICEMEDEFEEDDSSEYSQTGMSQRGMSSRNSSYRGSYDSMSNRGRSNRGMSYRNYYDGMSGRWPMSYDDAKFNMVHKLGDLMMCTENEHTKSVLRNAISQLEGN